MRNNQTAVNILGSILDAGPYIIIGASFLIGIAAIVALLGVDIYTGQIVGEHLTQDSIYGIFISLATTGLIIAASGFLLEGINRNWNFWLVLVMGIIVLALMGTDSYFDGISVDVKRFGAIVDVSATLSAPEAFAHNLFRFLVAGVSLIGEPLATASVLFFPAMKKFLRSLFGEVSHERPEPSSPVQRPSYPTPRPSVPAQPFANYHPVQNQSQPTYRPVGLSTK